MNHFYQHLLIALGLKDTSSSWYAFWSGFGGDLPLFGGLFGLYHKHNCHAPHCPRLGKHEYKGTPYCTKHHPILGEQQ